MRQRGLFVNRAINPSAALSESQRSYLYMVVYGETPPVSLTLNHLPFQGRHGHFVLRADAIRPY